MNSHSSGRRQWEGGCALEASGVRPRREGRCGVQDPKAFFLHGGRPAAVGRLRREVGRCRRLLAAGSRANYSRRLEPASACTFGNHQLSPQLGAV